MVLVIITKDTAGKIGELRGCHHNLSCIVEFFKKGKMKAEEVVERIEPHLIEAERLWKELEGEGL